MTVVDQKVATEGARGEIVDATGAISHISHDNRLNMSESIVQKSDIHNLSHYY